MEDIIFEYHWKDLIFGSAQVTHAKALEMATTANSKTDFYSDPNTFAVFKTLTDQVLEITYENDEAVSFS